MTTLAQKIFALIETHSDEEARKALSEVVREFDLNVAANLIEQNVEPMSLTRGGLEENFYSEGNDQAGHLPLQRILHAFEEVINTDKSEKGTFTFEDHPVRHYTEEELKEEGKDTDIEWYRLNEDITLSQLSIGFEAM